MRRRWLQFSLRGFFLATTVFVVWLGWVAERAMRQKEAVALLDAWGARIDYGHYWQGPGKPPKKASSPGWSWLRKVLGPHFFDKVVNVELIAGERLITAEEEAAAGPGGTSPLPSSLLILTDRDFMALAYLPHLRRLQVVGDFRATETALRRLGRLKNLETLMLDNVSGRSTGGVTDGALPFVERMPYLTTLHVEGNQITDAGLAGARWPAGLVELDLSGNRITDAAIEHLQSITSLRRLVILDTRVTDVGLAKLQATLPNCRIRRRPW